MKTEIIPKSNTKEIEYPCFMEYIDDGFIILVTGKKEYSYTGTVVSKSKIWDLGYFCSNWNVDGFQPFIGTIKLSNDED